MIPHFTSFVEKCIEPLLTSLDLEEECKTSIKELSAKLGEYILSQQHNPEFRKTIVPWLIPLLRQLPKADPLKLESVYNHPVGYMKFVLLDAGPYGNIRLHYWPKGKVGCRGDFHDHRWSFLSIPLLGTFSEERFKRVPGEKLILCASYPLQKSGEREFKPIGRGALHYENTFLHEPLVPFSGTGGVVHRLFPEKNTPAVSLVFRGPIARDYAEVWLPEDHQHPLIKVKKEKTNFLF